MLTIHGPSYKHTGERLTEPAVVYVEDHHYDEQIQGFHLQSLLRGMTDYTVVFDHVVHHEEFVTNAIYFPTLMARETAEFNQQIVDPVWDNKHEPFNFMINKSRPHRVWLLDLLYELDLRTSTYSLCWQESPVPIYTPNSRLMGTQTQMSRGIRNQGMTNAEIYQHMLRSTVFEPSYVALITEPACYEKETIVTEKTLMAFWGGNVPIWVGGWKIPQYLKSLGFDIFEDCVDHSYQDLPDPKQRCREALLRNKHVLDRCLTVDNDRLKHNLQLAQSNPWLLQIRNLVHEHPWLERKIPVSINYRT